MVPLKTDAWIGVSSRRDLERITAQIAEPPQTPRPRLDSDSTSDG
jgi:hypothetical protein